MVMHGTHDDNVHYQQSMMLAGALEEKDILFRQQSYPDQVVYDIHTTHFYIRYTTNELNIHFQLSKVLFTLTE